MRLFKPDAECSKFRLLLQISVITVVLYVAAQALGFGGHATPEPEPEPEPTQAEATHSKHGGHAHEPVKRYGSKELYEQERAALPKAKPCPEELYMKDDGTTGYRQKLMC